MAYKKEDMIKQCLKAIQENKLVFINEIPAFVPFNRATFYNHELDKLDSIKNELEKNRIQIKSSLRAKWYKSTSPVLQIALYRLIATEQEYERLILERVDHTSKGESIRPLEITVTKNENIDKYEKHLEKIANLN